jgi:outer membrane protein assembly factor BamE (lipoprotein component of BamABCDE complex)
MRIVLAIIAIFALLAAFIAALFFRSFDTQYSVGYSEAAFKSVRLGDTEQHVLAVLGSPLSSNDTKPFVTWIYSKDKQDDFTNNGIGSGTYTTVTFDDSGRVTGIFGQRQEAANRFVIGDGANYLKLTRADIERLKGSNEDAVKREFGSPVALYRYKACKVLNYSRSPSSSNYHLRKLGIDGEGKVVHIWREIYWD